MMDKRKIEKKSHFLDTHASGVVEDQVVVPTTLVDIDGIEPQREREKTTLFLLWGHTYMTSARRGREGGSPKRDDSTDRLREWDSDKGEGVQKSENFADVI